MLLVRSRRHVDPAYYRGPRHEFDHLGGGRASTLLGVGAIADQLGYAGPQDDDACASLLAGRAARGATLVHPRRSVEAYECIFAAPKAMSVLALCAPPTTAAAVVEAHERAVDAARAYLEAAALAPAGRVDPTERGEGMAGLATLHGVSRSGDPHLHTHLLVANLTRSEAGRFRPLDGRGLLAHRAAAGALYDAELHGEVVRVLGVDVSSMDPLAVAALSARRAEVAETGRRWSTPGPTWDRPELEARWGAALAVVGTTATEVVDLDRAPALPTRLDERRFAVALLGSEGAITRRRVVEAWARASGGATAADVRACVALVAADRGDGVFERHLAPRAVVASDTALARLGARPLDPSALRHWLEREGRRVQRERGGTDRELGSRSADHGRVR